MVVSKKKRKNNNGFKYIFVFTVVWVCSLVFYFTDGYFDFNFKAQIWITSVPIFFTFLIICIVIENLIQIHNQLAKNRTERFLNSIKYFRIAAIFCVST